MALGVLSFGVRNAALKSSSPFTPLSASGTGNDNLYYTGTHGQLFNPGSGLGYPDLGKLADDFSQPAR